MRWAFGLILVGGMLLPGCGSVKTPFVAYSDDGQYLRPPTGSGLVMDPNSPIPDVPKPVGFVGVPSLSSHSFDGRVRQVQHVYQGRGEVSDVLLLYKRWLPRYDWQSLAIQGTTPNTVLRYIKGREQLSVVVSKSSGVISIVVNIESQA